jgi:exosortase/archaeosortase family protein
VLRLSKNIANKSLGIYLFKFAFVFCILYYGTKLMIGLSIPGGYYSGIIQKYFNIASWLRGSLMHASSMLVNFIGFDSKIEGDYIIRIKHGTGVRIVYGCLGYGVMSFWVAFVFANAVTIKKKIVWIFGGCLLIWIINVLRISILLIAVNKHWKNSSNIDHHTLFNIAAYILIFVLIYFFDRSQFQTKHTLSEPLSSKDK